MVTFDVVISSLVTEVSHQIHIANLSCEIQGGPLMERKKQSSPQ